MNYSIETTTLALVPYAHPHYQTKIWDERGIFYSNDTCNQLINAACLRNGSSARGKQEAIRTILQFKQNIPIPISFQQRICAIPSTSSRKWECIWFFYTHIKEFRPCENKTLVRFHNGDELLINSSLYYANQQLWKAGHILTSFQSVSE